MAQHETDHLDGVVYLQRMPDIGELVSEEECERQATEVPPAAADEASPE